MSKEEALAALNEALLVLEMVDGFVDKKVSDSVDKILRKYGVFKGEKIELCDTWFNCSEKLPPDHHVVIAEYTGPTPWSGNGGIIDLYVHDGEWFNFPKTATVKRWMYIPDHLPESDIVKVSHDPLHQETKGN